MADDRNGVPAGDDPPETPELPANPFVGRPVIGVPAAGMPSEQLLESVHDFPCTFTFKAIGKDDRSFAARVVSVVRDELKLDEDPQFGVNRTASGRHLCVTVEPTCPTSKSVLAIYAQIRTLDGLVMLL